MSKNLIKPALIRKDSVGSTNEEAFLLFEGGATAPFFVTADFQTAGRGRSGRIWDSPKGNLYLSALLENPASIDKLPQLGFVAGVALIDALVTVAQSSCFHLKWPNDVLVDGAKLAGILLETRSIRGKQAVVIGWGVNIVEFPKNLPYRAIDLPTITPTADLDPLRQQLMKSFSERLMLWDRGDNFDEIRDLWLQFALSPGMPLVIRTGETQNVEGVFETIDHDGALILKTKNGSQRILAGDVILPEAQQGAA
ncbi:MAG: biotin--[acetyl-CoA-carboxylase] ligase [Pseudomonadota bacterium]